MVRRCVGSRRSSPILRYHRRTPKCLRAAHASSSASSAPGAPIISSHAYVPDVPAYIPLATSSTAVLNVPVTSTSPVLSTIPFVRPLDHTSSISIQSWNINGDFPLQMSCPNFRKDLTAFDINLFQETHLRPDQEDTVILPHGYSSTDQPAVYARAREAASASQGSFSKTPLQDEDSGSSGKFTSFQGQRRTVIDYGACSRGLYENVKSFSVADRLPGYDHAALTVEIKFDIGETNRALQHPRKKLKKDVILPTETELDRLLIRTLEAGKDEERKSLTLYGQVLANSDPLKVTVHGSCINSGKITASAGAAAYWGPNSRRNLSERTWGMQTNARAELVAVLLALRTAPSSKTLEIATRSEYAIRSVVYSAPMNAACGWRCLNGDILRLIFVLIKSRAAPIVGVTVVL
ncbi:hypothetical protein R3P38DRAFT_3620855 [Favolaschia claudopus]|uniref:RNase H type-1 domain-containing protein n=1 Tax=Favolaschia claudopus TaxID=2862362 RepID=A0AAW0DDR7_9AGAR